MLIIRLRIIQPENCVNKYRNRRGRIAHNHKKGVNIFLTVPYLLFIDISYGLRQPSPSLGRL